MFGFLETALVFTIIIASIIGAMFVYTVKKKGSVESAVSYWKSKKLFPDMQGLLYIPHIILFTALILSLVYFNFAKGETSYLNYVQVNAGIEWEVSDNPFRTCIDSSDELGKFGSNLGVELNLIQYRKGWFDVDVNGVYTHHSCAIETDYRVYDAIGVQTAWRFNSPWGNR